MNFKKNFEPLNLSVKSLRTGRITNQMTVSNHLQNHLFIGTAEKYTNMTIYSDIHKFAL
jgi:hypothetical protein